ncbi:MAG TPA: hypothetical protein VII63_02000 [Caulobacteraceae bacterium]
MRLFALATALALAAGAALAQGAPTALPRAFAGYAQPAIGAAACRMVSAAETQCLVPAMTAGRYLIEASGTSTSQAADARQGLAIEVGAAPCGTARPANPAPWPSGPRTFKVDCEVTLLTDRPLTVRAIYADFHAVKDPKGPTLTMRALPWAGVMDARMFAP